MKKIIITLALILGLTTAVEAQSISKNALGLRLGSNDGFGGELSYQRKLSKNNRLELDLGLRSNNGVSAFKGTALYQWVWNIEGGFYWYAGVGGGLGSWKVEKNGINSNGTFLFVAGDLGIEYNFDAPIQIALDIRPELYFNSDNYRTNNFGPDIAFSIRYRFN